MSEYTRYPNYGNGVIDYPTAANFPATGNTNGNLALALDTSTLYEWNGTTWVAIATPGAAIALDGLIGDGTATGPGVAPLTLATVNSNVGTFGSSSLIPVITVNGKGLITAVTTAAAPTGTVTSVGLSSPGVLYTVSGSPVTTSGTLTLNLISQAQNSVLAGPTSGSGAPSFRALTSGDLPAGTGTVTSVGLSTPGVIFSVAGSPVTTSGTLTLSLLTQAANMVFAGPTSGSAAAPTFRSLVAADIPAISLTSGVSGILPYANGGTNASTSWTAGSVIFAGASSLSQDNSKLFWNDTNFELGIGTASPGANLQISGTATGTKNLIIKEIASQTADPFEIQNSSGTSLVNVSAAGNVGVATATAASGTGLNYALPAAAFGITIGLGISQTGVVFPATTIAQSISLTSDTTAYGSQFGNLVGVNVNLTNSKPDTTNNGSVQTTGFSAVVTNSAAINTAATNTSYGTYGSGGEAIESGAVSGSTNGALFFNYGGEFTAAATATFSTSGTNSITNRGVSAIAENTASSKATAGVLNVTDVGCYAVVFGSTGAHSTSTAYGVYASASGDTTNYDFYGASGNPNVFTGTAAALHYIGYTGAAAPSLSAGAGAGTSPTVSFTGTDVAGAITVTTGTTPSASSAVVTLTFGTAYTSAPYVTLTAANANTAALSVTGVAYVTETTTTFVINIGTTALAATTTYIWNYSVIQ